MTPEALEAERIAGRFGLSYLSREGFEKLARLLAWVRSAQPPPPVEHPPDIVKPPPERVGGGCYRSCYKTATFPAKPSP